MKKFNLGIKENEFARLNTFVEMAYHCFIQLHIIFINSRIKLLHHSHLPDTLYINIKL